MNLKVLLIILFTFFSTKLLAIDPVGKIAKANQAKEDAWEAYSKGDFKEAVKHYAYLLDSLGYEDDQAQLNRAHAYFQLKDTINAFDNYRQLSTADNHKIRSRALLQMGNLSEQQKEYENALSFFKESLKSDPTNEKARYNYELLKKKMQEQENQDQNQDKNQDQQDEENKDENEDGEQKEDSDKQKQDENQDKSKEDQESEDQQQKDDADKQDGQDQESKEGEDQEQQESDQQKEGEEGKEEEEPAQPSTKQKLEEMNISEEKAMQILEALRNKESQYLQQLRKKPQQKPQSGKPDW